MEELVGLEPTHVGFAIRGITSFAIAPKKLWYFCVFTFIKKSGRGQGIRTLGGFHLAGFQNRYNRPTLSILYNLMVRMVRIELTKVLFPINLKKFDIQQITILSILISYWQNLINPIKFDIHIIECEIGVKKWQDIQQI